MERPPFLLHHFCVRIGLIPTPFTRVRIYYIPSYFRGRETFSKAKRRFALLRWRLVLYLTCVSSTAPRSLLWYYHYSALRTTVVFSWLYSELGHTLAFSNCGSNQFHTIRTLITNHHNLFHSPLLFPLAGFPLSHPIRWRYPSQLRGTSIVSLQGCNPRLS